MLSRKLYSSLAAIIPLGSLGKLVGFEGCVKALISSTFCYFFEPSCWNWHEGYEWAVDAWRIGAQTEWDGSVCVGGGGSLKYSSGTLDLSLLGLHRATLHVLPDVQRLGPLCCPELSSHPWRWAAESELAKFPKRIRHTRRLRSQRKAQAHAVVGPMIAPPPQCSQARVLGETRTHTHPKPTPRVRG